MALPRLEGTARSLSRQALNQQRLVSWHCPVLRGLQERKNDTAYNHRFQVSWHCPVLRGLQVNPADHALILEQRFMALPRLEGTARTSTEVTR